jgi:hypothetical protein
MGRRPHMSRSVAREPKRAPIRAGRFLELPFRVLGRPAWLRFVSSANFSWPDGHRREKVSTDRMLGAEAQHLGSRMVRVINLL